MAAAATTTMAIALTVAGSGYLASANLAHMAAMLEAQVEVVGFLRRGLPASEQRRALAEVRGLPGVLQAEFVGRAEALRRMQRTFRSLASVSDMLPANPLPDTIEVRVGDARQVHAVAEALRRVRGIEDVVYGASVVDRLVALTRGVRMAGAGVTGLLAAAALLIIINTVQITIAARRQEIEIMTLVGASSGFVRAPFLLEGALQGIGAGLAATLLVVGGYAALVARVTAALPFLPLLPPASVLPGAVTLVWVLGIAVGVGGSEVAMRRHLHL
jgi:cell division transport system permease protein